MNFQRILQRFTKLLEDDRISTDIDIYERLWTGLRIICRNRFLYLGTTML